VDLQKILLTLFFINLIDLVFIGGFTFWGSLAYGLVLIAGIRGASRRSRCWLVFYHIVQTVLVVLTAVAIILQSIGLIAIYSQNKEEISSKSKEFFEQSNVSTTSWVLIGIATLLYVVCIFFLKIRSIVLARRMIRQLDELPTLEDGQTITNEDTIELTPSQPETPVAPQPPVYVVPSYQPQQPVDAAQFQQMYPVPFYVDQYGRPIQAYYPPQ